MVGLELGGRNALKCLESTPPPKYSVSFVLGTQKEGETRDFLTFT